MAKKRNCKQRPKAKQQICVPKCCQQPRSHATRRRTDFSLFFSPSHSSSLPECSKMEFLSFKDNLSSITTVAMDRHGEMQNFPLVQCITAQNGGNGGIRSKCTGVPFSEMDSDRNQPTCNNGNNVQHKSNNVMPLPHTPSTCISQVTAYSDVWTAPGSVIWAKTACEMWWPAKIMGERSTPVTTNDLVVRRHVLVQYYGNQEFAWLDPAGDVSQFDEFFEERSCNPTEAFQDALKQALCRKEHLASCRRLDRSFDEVKVSNQLEQSSGGEPNKWTESSSSRAEDDYLERGRGKRKRKPKVHFDEVTFPVKSTKKMRRFRIMRHLGLAAPIGSPFSVTSRVRTIY